jgi:hypothetical protein
MREVTPPLPQYAFMAWCSVKAQGQLYLYLVSAMQCDNIHAYRKKGKVIPVLFLTKHHAMKTYWGSGGIAPLIL